MATRVDGGMGTPIARGAVVEWARDIYDDLDFTVVRQWLQGHPKGKAGGYLPVYAPREVLHATGFLPVGIHGGGDRLGIIRGDAFYQSYICHLPRSVIELAQSGRLDMLSAVLFPSTCDVIRNLSGIWKLLYPDVYVRYVDVPQIPDPGAAAEFWAGELHRLLDDLAGVTGHPKQSLAGSRPDPKRPRDNSRVVIVGAFCEQPPLGLIKSIERAGWYIVDDDFLLGNRLLTHDVPNDRDP